MDPAEDQQTEAENESTTVEGQEPAQEPEQQETSTEGTPSNEKPSEDESALPEWARERISKANREAASYRTQLREAQDALSKAKTPEDFQTIQDQLAETQHKLIVTSIAHEFGIPDALASRLQGTTEEEIRADAEALKSLVAPKPAGRTPGTPSGGLDPEENQEPAFDAAAWAVAQRKHF